MPSSLEEINLNLRLAKYCSGKLSDLEAINLIESYIALNLPIPKELNPHVSQAISGWHNVKGQINNRSNSDQYWNNLIELTHKYHLLGYTLDDAKTLVIKEHPKTYKGNPLTVDRLEREYNNRKYRPLKEAIKKYYGLKRD